MRQRISRRAAASLLAAGALALPVAGAVTPAPATSVAGCPDGQTGVIYGCAPFCVDGKALDVNTGLCMPVAPPPPAPPPPATPRY
jgi:hypothetical protein